MTITELARQAIAHYFQTGQPMSPPARLPDELRQPAAAFVTLHNPDGSLRGCIGTTAPTAPSLAAEVINNAVAAAVDDPRFNPLDPAELPGLRLSVDVLAPPVPASSPANLDPKIDGLIVSAQDGRRGVLLPDLEGVTTPDQQIAICRDKAGIGDNEPITLAKFQVHRYED